MLTAEQVQTFQKDGYVKGSRVLTDEQVGLLQEEMARVIRDKDDAARPQPVMLHNMGKPDAAVWQIVDIWMASDPFKQLVFNPRIAEEIAQLTDAKRVRLWHDQIQYKPASIGGVNMWHQDAPYWPVLKGETEVTAWVALDDVDAENGCMSMVPGSHRWGNTIQFLHTIKDFEQMPAEYEGKKVAVRLCPVRRGEVHYHHSLTWHGSNANRSGRPRRAIALHYMTDDTKFVAAGNHPMKRLIHVPDGAPVEGDAFPQVWPIGR